MKRKRAAPKPRVVKIRGVKAYLVLGSWKKPTVSYPAKQAWTKANTAAARLRRRYGKVVVRGRPATTKARKR